MPQRCLSDAFRKGFGRFWEGVLGDFKNILGAFLGVLLKGFLEFLSAYVSLFRGVLQQKKFFTTRSFISSYQFTATHPRLLLGEILARGRSFCGPFAKLPAELAGAS